MSYEKMEALGGIQWPCNANAPKEQNVSMPKRCPAKQQTEKQTLLSVSWMPLSEMTSKTLPLMLNTGRTVEQFHTRTKTGTVGILDALAPEAWVDLHPNDAVQLQVKSGDRIALSGSRGRVEDVIVKVSQTVREGNIFVPFHYNEQLINAITLAEFDPKSFEPNYKQCAVQLHSKAVPEGIVYEEIKISGFLEGVKHYEEEGFLLKKQYPIRHKLGSKQFKIIQIKQKQIISLGLQKFI